MTMLGNAAYLENRILSADPIELIAILYEHAICFTGNARESLAKRDIPGRSAMISRVIAILGELDGSLNHSAGGEISANLARLYQYMRERLMLANLKQEDAPLAEVERLLTTLAEAWDGVKHSGSQHAPAIVSPYATAPFIPDAPAYQNNPFQTNSYTSQAWTA
jgi:flagellar secretion chaperone FliS